MALPFPATYYMGIGYALSNAGIPSEISGGSYARLACGYTGTAMAGLTQTTSAWIVATAPTPAVNCYYGMIFDSLTGGDLIAYWTWNSPYTGSLTAFPATTISIAFTNNYAVAMNMALLGLGAAGTYGSLIDQGAQIGTVNGQPLIAGNRLSIGSNGQLNVHNEGGEWDGSLDVEDTLSFAGLATTNIVTGVTALAGGSSTSSTPVMTGFYNVLSTVATSLDSVILPSIANAPVGSMLVIRNSGAASAGVYPDTGANINAHTGGTQFVLPTVAGCIFCRVSPLLWLTVPTVPS